MNDLMMTVPAEPIAEQAIDSGDTAAEQANPAQSVAAEEMPVDPANTDAVQGKALPMLSDDEAVYMPIYNGQARPIRADEREEITTLLQLGMKQRDFLPSYERLSRLAADSGAPSIKAFIHDLCDRQEQLLLARAIEQYGDDGGRRIYELEKAERCKRYETLENDEAARQAKQRYEASDKLAAEFSQLQTMYPEYTDIRQLPRQVTESALQNGIALLDAYNRFAITEQRRLAEHQQRTAAAAAQSTGSLAQHGETPSSAMDAFLSGLHSRT